jgi:outer membrane murein-binding lipoprotein Lpp
MFKNSMTIAVAAAAAFALVGCGSSSKASTTATVGTSGATLKAGVATLSIPAGAVSQNTQVTLREAEVRHSGRTVRIEMEPNDLPLAQPCNLSIKIDDKNVKVKMVDDNGGMNQVEVEDRNHHQFKTTMSHLGEVEVELEHGLNCATACSATEECDDGVCKAHAEDEHATTCDPVCGSGQECDDGACKTHNEFESGHGGTPGTCDPACASGMECDASDSVCKPHGGTP